MKAKVNCVCLLVASAALAITCVVISRPAVVSGDDKAASKGIKWEYKVYSIVDDFAGVGRKKAGAAKGKPRKLKKPTSTLSSRLPLMPWAKKAGSWFVRPHRSSFSSDPSDEPEVDL